MLASLTALEAAGWVENAFGLFEIEPQPAIKAAGSKRTQLCNSVGGVRMLITFLKCFPGQGLAGATLRKRTERE